MSLNKLFLRLITHISLWCFPADSVFFYYYPFDTVKCIKNMLSLSSVLDSQIGLVCIINFNLTNIFWCQILLVKNYSYIRAVILENCEQCYPYLIFSVWFMLFQTLKKMCSCFCFISLSLFFSNTWNLIYQETVLKMNHVVEKMFICKERKWWCPSHVKQLA